MNVIVLERVPLSVFLSHVYRKSHHAVKFQRLFHKLKKTVLQPRTAVAVLTTILVQEILVDADITRIEMNATRSQGVVGRLVLQECQLVVTVILGLAGSLMATKKHVVTKALANGNPLEVVETLPGSGGLRMSK